MDVRTEVYVLVLTNEDIRDITISSYHWRKVFHFENIK